MFSRFQSTFGGSVPHTDVEAVSRCLAAGLDIPAWPQMPRLSYRESMYAQFSPTMPRIVEDPTHGKVCFDTQGDMTEDLAEFYQKYIDDDLDAFALKPDYAAGFFAFLEQLKNTPGEWAKGHVTGPISFGLTVTDQDLQPGLYFDDLADVIAKNMGMNARWQVRKMKELRPKAVVFVDEPYMAQFGSAFISLNRGQALNLLNEVFDAVHKEDALAGVHCCANTDWSVLLDSHADILNLDAYGYVENLALYPQELRAFLHRGGIIAWGLVPNTEDAFERSAQDMLEHWERGIQMIVEKAARRGVTFSTDDFRNNCLITTACGLGSTTVDVADRALDLLAETTALMRSRE